MFIFSDRAKSGSGGSSSGQVGSTKSTSKTNEGTRITTQDKTIIEQASTIPIISVLRLYGIKIDNSTKKIHCPFSDLHKNGIDRSASFYIYRDTNSFYCFGCQSVGNGIAFVAQIEGINRYKAAQKILTALENEVDIDNLQIHSIDFSETTRILMGFSNYIREKIHNNMDNSKYLKFIDDVCGAIDGLYEKYAPMQNETLRVIVDRLKKKVEDYK